MPYSYNIGDVITYGEGEKHIKVEVITKTTVRVLEGCNSGNIMSFKDYYFLIGVDSVNQRSSFSEGEKTDRYLESCDKYYKEDIIKIQDRIEKYNITPLVRQPSIKSHVSFRDVVPAPAPAPGPIPKKTSKLPWFFKFFICGLHLD